jgi:hypothetical protein
LTLKTSSIVRVAGALGLLVATMLSGAAPASAGGPFAVLTVTKTVQGSPPEGAEFVIEVECFAVGGRIPDSMRPMADTLVLDETLTFGPGGGSESFDITPMVAFDEVSCSVVETDDGGADRVEGGDQLISMTEPGEYDAEVINEFDPVEPTTSTTTASTTTTAAPGSAVATPRFTG